MAMRENFAPSVSPEEEIQSKIENTLKQAPGLTLSLEQQEKINSLSPEELINLNNKFQDIITNYNKDLNGLQSKTRSALSQILEQEPSREI